MVKFKINKDKCIGCNVCGIDDNETSQKRLKKFKTQCPVDAIEEVK